MKHIILTAVVFSIFSSVLSPMTASARGCGILIAEKLVKQANSQGKKHGENEKQLLAEIITPQARGFFKIREDRYSVDLIHYPVLRALGFGKDCHLIDPHLKKRTYWALSCSVD